MVTSKRDNEAGQIAVINCRLRLALAI
jgi:hypothetical protein